MDETAILRAEIYNLQKQLADAIANQHLSVVPQTSTSSKEARTESASSSKEIRAESTSSKEIRAESTSSKENRPPKVDSEKPETENLQRKCIRGEFT